MIIQINSFNDKSTKAILKPLYNGHFALEADILQETLLLFHLPCKILCTNFTAQNGTSVLIYLFIYLFIYCE